MVLSCGRFGGLAETKDGEEPFVGALGNGQTMIRDESVWARYLEQIDQGRKNRESAVVGVAVVLQRHGGYDDG